MKISSTLPELWQQKASIQKILDRYGVKYIQGNEIKPASLINQDTLVLSNTAIFDRKLQKEIDTDILLTKNGREYRVIMLTNNSDCIANLKFKVIRTNDLGIFFKDILSKQQTEEAIKSQNGREYCTIIGGFENSDPKRFINAGKKLGLCALQLFKKFGIENIFFGALPPPNKPSPLTYYMRGKFQPLNTTEQEILKLTDNYKKRANPNTNYAMIMPQNADILKLAEKYNFLKAFD